MTFEEFTNTTDRGFDDISSETYRRYELIHQNETVEIEDPIAVHIDERLFEGSQKGYARHLVVNSQGNVFRVPFNPSLDLLFWNTSEDSEQVVL